MAEAMLDADDDHVCRSAARRGDTGLERPYRPLPVDFRERFLELGQSKELEEHYRTNWRVIRRWIEEAGGDALRKERYRISGGTPRPKLRSKAARYVMGRRMTAVRAKGPKG